MMQQLFSLGRPKTPRAKALLFLACFLCVAAVMAVYFFADLPIDTDDDWTMALALSGNYGPGGNCLFMNSALACLTYQLNVSLAGVNWFILFELVGALFGMTFLLYVCIEEVGLGLSLAASLFLVKFGLPFATYASNYTTVTALVAAPGALLLLVWAKRLLLDEDTLEKWMLPAGVVMTIFGMCWRPSSFMLMLPFAFIATAALAIAYFKKSRADNVERKAVWGKAKPVCLSVVIIVALCGVLAVFDNYMWSIPEWADWKAYNTARSQISDFPVKDYEEIADELAAIGVSKNDYAMSLSWSTNDRDFFTVEKIEAISKIAQKKTDVASASDMVQELKMRLKSNKWEYAVWFVVCLLVGLRIALLEHKRGMKPWLLAALLGNMLGVAAISVYFTYAGRFPLRVVMSLLISSAVLAVFLGSFGEKPVFAKAKTPYKAQAVAVGLCSLLLLGMTTVSVGKHFDAGFWRSLQNPAPSSSTEPLYEYITTQEGVYVWDTIEGYVIEGTMYGCRFLPDRSFMLKNLSLGGWTSRGPFRVQLEAEAGMPNVYKGLLENDNAYYVSLYQDTVDSILIFLREHYAPNAHVEEVTQVEGYGQTYKILKFVA